MGGTTEEKERTSGREGTRKKAGHRYKRLSRLSKRQEINDVRREITCRRHRDRMSRWCLNGKRTCNIRKVKTITRASRGRHLRRTKWRSQRNRSAVTAELKTGRRKTQLSTSARWLRKPRCKGNIRTTWRAHGSTWRSTGKRCDSRRCYQQWNRNRNAGSKKKRSREIHSETRFNRPNRATKGHWNERKMSRRIV